MVTASRNQSSKGGEITIGFSPCPNDTFIFYGLLHGHVGINNTALAPAVLADVETLNAWALAGRLDVTKLSFHALAHVLDEYVLLKSGGALGYGCGPLLVAARDVKRQQLPGLKIAIPGRYTTAAALLQQFVPDCPRVIEMRFDAIMPAIVRGDVDCGVIIHESRFTYGKEGLRLVVDLGAWWEAETGGAIPLGCIAAKRSLGNRVVSRIEKAIGDSVRWAWAHQAQCLPYVKQQAQELEESVVLNHIGLYVNQYSENLGADGLAAVEVFLERGRQKGMWPAFDGQLTWE
jgi:1,4-dihydroxy-6-naphthoate synthase